MINSQTGQFGDYTSVAFLSYISRNITALQQKKNKKKHHHSLQKIDEEIHFFSKMREHYYNSLKQSISNGAAPDPHLSSLLKSFSSQSLTTLATILVFGSLTNYQTFLKHQMISINQAMFEEFEKIKSQIFNPLSGLQYNEEITLDQTIRKVQITLNNVVNSYSLNQYLQQLQIVKNKPLTICKEEVVIEQVEQEENQEEKIEILKINNSSGESQKPKKSVVPNYEGDEEVFTGESDQNIHEKKNIKKYMKKKKTNKKYVEEENYEASQEEGKHKKNRHVVWRHHLVQQGFDTDKDKK